MDANDARQKLESGGDARCRCGDGRSKAAAVLVIQCLLTAACAAFSLYFYLHHNPGSNKQQDTGIFLQSIQESHTHLEWHDDDTEPTFRVIWNRRMHLKDKNKVQLICGGPYIVYVWACVQSYGTNGIANLTIEQGSRSIHLQSMQEMHMQKCQETHSMVMLSDKREVTITFKSDPDVSIKKLHLGLHYMLGAQCFNTPSPPSGKR